MTTTEQEQAGLESGLKVQSRLRHLLERVFDMAEHRHVERITNAVRRLEATYPEVRLSQGNLDAFVSGLLDLPIDAVEHAVESARRTEDRMPRLSMLRRLALTHHLDLPEPGEALELVEKWVQAGSTAQCPECGGTGVAAEVDAEVESLIESAMPEDETLRNMLERVREAGLKPSSCPECGGTGRGPALDRAALPAVVKRAVDALGGVWAWKTADNRGVLRGQFNRLYEEFRRDALSEPMSGKELGP